MAKALKYQRFPISKHSVKPNLKTTRYNRLFLVFQGAGPEQWMLDAGVYSVERFAGMYGMTYEGMAHNAAEAKKLANALDSVRE